MTVTERSTCHIAFILGYNPLLFSCAPEVSLCSLSYVQVHILMVAGEKKIVARYSKFNSGAMSSSSWLLVLLRCFPPELGIIKIPPTCCVTDLQSWAASQGCLDHVCLHKENWAKHFQNKPSEKKAQSVAEHNIWGGGFQKAICHSWEQCGVCGIKPPVTGGRGCWADGMDFTFTEVSRNQCECFFCMFKNNKLEKCCQITFFWWNRFDFSKIPQQPRSQPMSVYQVQNKSKSETSSND